MGDWSAAQYLKFKKQRTQPSVDLVNKIETEKPRRILDIGCGPGNSTAVLKQKFPNTFILGVDSSADMIKTARENNPDMAFEQLTVPDGLQQLENDFDIVFSNACLQWIPHHQTLFPQLMSKLKSGGTFAVQMPMQQKQEMRRIIDAVAGSDRWIRYFTPYPHSLNILVAEQYFDILSQIADDFDISETVYYHRMPSHESLLEWYKGTGLRPYYERLNEAQQAEFESDLLTEAKRHFPIQQNGEIIFRFPRLFIVAKK